MSSEVFVKRSGHCKACGATIRPRAKDMSVAAASRLHYWKYHREVMMAGVAKAAATVRKKKAEQHARRATRKSEDGGRRSSRSKGEARGRAVIS